MTLWSFKLFLLSCIAVSVLPVFLDMASLLREQTRVKESLEGALEKQKEGNDSNKFLNVCACMPCVIQPKKYYPDQMHLLDKQWYSNFSGEKCEAIIMGHSPQKLV